MSRVPLAPLLLSVLVLGAACPGSEGPTAPDAAAASRLPSDYPAGFVEVRGCRPSVDHALTHIVVKAPAAVAAIYDGGPFPFPAGALVVKEEFADAACASLSGYTLMLKEAAGYDEAWGDWRWQRLDGAGRVVEDGRLRRCASCHAATACRARDFTCAEP